MTPSPQLVELVARWAPLWAGEAEVIRAYLDDPARTPARDRRWIVHQAYKEYWDGYAAVLARLHAQVGSPDVEAAEELAEVLAEELAHYRAFVALHEALGPDPAGPLTPERARREGPWPENDALRALRAAHRQAHGPLGARAQWLSEGGYVALYREGARLAGRGGFDEAVAHACTAVLEDEIDHMLEGLRGLEEAGLSPDDWQTLGRIVHEQLAQRIRMRHAQFDAPVGPERLEALCRGEADPMPFDWVRAGRA
ncbi:MAG: hypothetical protein H6732_04410 [Alphaproteobacteria bacterium]|nr:hypothetical protein [Alphaproteobacteria bacterium]